jgi:hypothetical protein
MDRESFLVYILSFLSITLATTNLFQIENILSWALIDIPAPYFGLWVTWGSTW